MVAEFEAERPRRVAADRESPPKPQPAASSLGMVVSELGDAQKRELKVKGGVKVESVEGAAARAGLREGDIVLALDNTEVTSAKQFETLVAKLDKARPVTLLVRRGENASFLILRPSR
jgi:serine protease Do